MSHRSAIIPSPRKCVWKRERERLFGGAVHALSSEQRYDDCKLPREESDEREGEWGFWGSSIYHEWRASACERLIDWLISLLINLDQLLTANGQTLHTWSLNQKLKPKTEYFMLFFFASDQCQIDPVTSENKPSQLL